MNPADARSRQPGIRNRFPFAAGLLALLILGASLLSSGCRKPPGRVDGDPDRTVTKGDPWEIFAKRLQKETDYAGCKTALGELSANLAAQENPTRLPALSSEAAAELAGRVPLNPVDLEEVRGSGFTTHDPVYLADCLYMQDAYRSLNLPGLPPDQLADLGFAWVCRQVYLNPWLVDAQGGKMATALPPTAVLRRGYGSGLERMYVFLALLQQMGLDGCLVGPPDAGDKPAGLVALGPDKKTVLTGAPRGPFWAVGVRVGGDVRLYDPWRGQPFPATLNQLKANPEAHKAWFEDKANAGVVTTDDAKKATIYLAVPVNGLSPRMAALEEKLKSDPKTDFARLAVNPAALQAAFPDPKPAFWNPPADRFAYGRASRTFLPPEQGGSESAEPSPVRLYDAYVLGMLPAGVFAAVEDLKDNPDAANRLRTAAAGVYLGAFYESPNATSPRERLQRGQFQDAAKDLVSKQDMFARGRAQLRGNREAQQAIRDWVARAKDLYDELGRAGLSGDKEAQAAARARAASDIGLHWRSPVAGLLVNQIVADIGQAEATFLLALCKHEQAERLQARLDHAAGTDIADLKQRAADAWGNALGEWRTYEGHADLQKGFPGREAHAEMLKARAEKLAAPK